MPDLFAAFGAVLGPIAIAGGASVLLVVIVLTIIEQRDRRLRERQLWFEKASPRHHSGK